MTNHNGPRQTVFVGDTFPSDKWGTLTVVEYNGTANVVVQFEDGNRTKTSVGAIRLGSVKNPYKPSVQGVGFLGDSHRAYPGNTLRATPEYKAWAGMLKRCYEPYHQSKYPAYVGCTVAPCWHDFSNFAEWYREQPKRDDSFHLDKDLLIAGNKVYSPEACSLVPRDINNLTLDRKSLRGEFPVGVTKHSQNGTFTAQMNISGDNRYIGSYSTPIEAFEAYKKAKEAHVKDVAAAYKSVISEGVYKALMNFTVNITD